MRNLKKVLAVILTVALFASMMMVPALAAVSNETEANALKAIGLFKGISDTDLGLATELTREQGIIFVIRAMGKEADALAMSAADVDAQFANVTDVDTIGTWAGAKNYAAYALKNGITNGIGGVDAGKVQYGGQLELAGDQVVMLLLRAFGHKTADVTKANCWDLAVAAKFLDATDVVALSMNNALTRDVVAGVLFSAVKDGVTTDGTLLIDKLIADGAVVKADATTAGFITAASISLEATGVKKLKATFSKAIDTATAVAVSKGSISVSTDKVEFAADGKSVLITTTTNLTKGDYTVKVGDLSATVGVVDQKLSKIEITSAIAPRKENANTFAHVNFKASNQYGEKMTVGANDITWTISTGKPIVNFNSAGSFEIQSASGDFIPEAIVYITGVHAATGTVVNGSVKIGLAAQAASVEFKGVYNVTGSKLEALPSGFANDKYVLLFKVSDQYGNKMSLADFDELTFTSDNPLFVSANTAAPDLAYDMAADVTVDGASYEAAKIVRGSDPDKGGTVNVRVISNVTGKVSTYTISADAKALLKTFSMSSPATMISETEKVEIPFTAVDQYGNSVTKYADLNGKVTLSPAGDLFFELQNDGSAKLFYKGLSETVATDNTDGLVYLTSLIPSGGSFSSVMLTIRELARPTAIVGLDSDVKTYIAQGNSVALKAKNLAVQDQYGRTMKDADVEAWLAKAAGNSIKVTSEKPATDKTPFTLNGDAAATAVIGAAADVATLAAKVASGLAATEKLVFELSTDSAATVISGSAKSLTFTSVALSAFKSYVADDLGLMYNDGLAATATDAAYDKTVKVYGVLENGTKVQLPNSDFAISPISKLAVTGAKITDVATGGYDASAFADNGIYKDVKVNVLITVLGANGAAEALIEKELVMSNKDPVVVAAAVKSVTDGKATINPTGAVDATTGDILTANLNKFVDATKAKDQYGVATTDAPTITIVNLTKVSGSAFTVANNGQTTCGITGAKLGDKFTAIYRYNATVSLTVDFTVGKVVAP